LKEPIIETERLILREISQDDAEFIYSLLNSASFIRFIGDRGVHSFDDAKRFIEDRYRQSYRDHGYGLYTVELKQDGCAIGICGFVRRESLPEPDIGFAFLPQFERQGYGLESARAALRFGCQTLGFKTVLAITTPDNDSSIRLLEKLGFSFASNTNGPKGEPLNLYSFICKNHHGSGV